MEKKCVITGEIVQQTGCDSFENGRNTNIGIVSKNGFKIYSQLLNEVQQIHYSYGIHRIESTKIVRKGILALLEDLKRVTEDADYHIGDLKEAQIHDVISDTLNKIAKLSVDLKYKKSMISG